MELKMEQSGKSHAKGDDKKWLDCTVNAIQMSVNSIGINKDLRPALEKNIQKNAGPFNLTFETESAGEKLRLNLHFKNDTSDYDFTGYQLTLLHPFIVDHRTINGIDTGELERKMKTTDWYYGIAEKPEEVITGHKNAQSIEADLKQLSRSEEGGIVAMHLWHNHVPANTVPKPDFIDKVEAALDFYPERTFSSNVKLDEACDIVRGYSREEPLTVATEHLRTEFAFQEHEPGEIKRHLQQLEAEGSKYVAYIENSIPMAKESLHGCKDTSDILQFNIKNSSGLHRCSFSSIEDMKDAAKQWSQLSEHHINTALIEQKMASADWHYEKVAPSREHWEKFDAAMEEIHKNLVLLCKLPGGIDKANALWDRYAPDAVTKPFFLQKGADVNSGIAQHADRNSTSEQLKPDTPTQTNAELALKTVKAEAPSKEKNISNAEGWNNCRVMLLQLW